MSQFPLKSCESVQNHFAQTATAGSHHTPLVPRAISKGGQDRKRTILSRTLFAVAGMAVMLAAHATRAEPLASPPPPGFPFPGSPQHVAHHSTAYCKQSELTGPEFIRSLNTIIKHGDLTDVSFIKKILGTKFTMSYGWAGDGSPDTKKLNYQADQMLGAPIQVSLYINTASQLKRESIAGISFDGNPMTALYPTFISDCLLMSRNDFSSSFGTRVFGGIPLPGDVPVRGDPSSPPLSSVGEDFDYPVKDGSRLELVIEYNAKDQTVSQVGIAEYR